MSSNYSVAGVLGLTRLQWRACCILGNLLLAVLQSSGQAAAEPPAERSPQAAAVKQSDAPIKDWSTIETIVVTASVTGPAMWHIEKNNSEVWVIPTVAPVPKALDWNDNGVFRAMKGARAVLVAPTVDANVFDLGWFLLTRGDSLRQPDGVKLESTLPEALRARFDTQRAALKEGPDKYDKWIAPVAALALLSDYRDKNDLTGNLEDNLRRLARRAGVPTKSIATVPVMDALREIPKMNATAQQGCLADVLREVETERTHALAAAQAWAVGNIPDIKANVSQGQADACFNGGVHLAELRSQFIDAYTNVIADALTRPGKTVVIMPIVIFLRQQSVLDRLVAAGAKVTGPAQ